jgi:midasin
VLKVEKMLEFFMKAQSSFLASLAKFSYVSQRVFLYLIYQGFCGREEEDREDTKQQEEDDKYLDGDGCGMGDGQGEQNVSNEIEHEEQLEGLKNYESEEEKEQEK